MHIFFNVYKNQLNRQTGSRNLMGPKTLPTIWHTYRMLVTKYQISAINSYWEKCDEKYLGQTEGRTEVKQYTPYPFGERGYNKLSSSVDVVVEGEKGGSISVYRHFQHLFSYILTTRRLEEKKPDITYQETPAFGRWLDTLTLIIANTCSTWS